MRSGFHMTLASVLRYAVMCCAQTLCTCKLLVLQTGITSCGITLEVCTILGGPRLAQVPV